MALRDEIHNVIQATPGLPPLELHAPVMDVPALIKHGAAFSRQADRADGEAWAAANGVTAAQRPTTWEPEPSTSQKKLLMQSLAWGDADALSKAARRMGILWESSDAAKFMAAVAMRERAQDEMGQRGYSPMHAELRTAVAVSPAVCAAPMPALTPAPAGAAANPPPPPAHLRTAGGAGPGLLPPAPPCRAGPTAALAVPAPSARDIAPERVRPGKHGAGARTLNVPQAQLEKNARAAAARAQKRQIARAAEVLERQIARAAEERERQQAQLELEQFRRQSLI